jgi:hypothetical protein
MILRPTCRSSLPFCIKIKAEGRPHEWPSSIWHIADPVFSVHRDELVISVIPDVRGMFFATAKCHERAPQARPVKRRDRLP